MAGCKFCPYRVDVPSGIWHAEEYEKLPPYDNLTMDQPQVGLDCHLDNGDVCGGWLAVSIEQPGLYASLSVRILEAINGRPLEKPNGDFFMSHTDAADHGLRHIDNPCTRARRAMAELGRKKP